MNKSLIIRSILITASVAVVALAVALPQAINADLQNEKLDANPVTLVYNGRLTICKLDKSAYNVVKTVKMTVTAYNSLPEQTDDTPFITASNKQVGDGIVAINGVPFGTKVKMPDLFGDKVFTVEDRLHPRAGTKRVDIWMAHYSDAIKFGARTTNIQFLEN